MKCLRCQNKDPRFFQKDHGVYYCRKCIGFSRLDVGMKVRPVSLHQKVWDIRPTLNYELTKHQKEVSKEIVEYVKKKQDVFVYAATGAGKTECTLESICFYLKQGKKVAFAISRRQVVLEIRDRLAQIFPSLKVIAVCQGYTTITDGDLIVCTTHQLYRYPYAFDLLILDEVDAFPYANNKVLQSIAYQSCRGQKIFLSATPDQEIQKLVQNGSMKMVSLFERPHQHLLPVPKVLVLPNLIQVLYILYFCHIHSHQQILVFVPERQDCIWMSLLLRCPYIHSQTEQKDEIMNRFRKKEFSILVCTTLLERGITVPSVQVIVYQGQHIVFTTASLIQIFGRVGRSFKDPEGEAICLCSYENESITNCVNQLNQMNNFAQSAMRKFTNI